MAHPLVAAFLIAVLDCRPGNAVGDFLAPPLSAVVGERVVERLPIDILGMGRKASADR
jgi:hypothetical protein